MICITLDENKTPISVARYFIEITDSDMLAIPNSLWFESGDINCSDEELLKQWRIVNGTLMNVGSAPHSYCVWNTLTKQWEDPRTLDDIKAAQWALIKQARSQAEYAGFTWDSSTFDSDATSQNRITGAVTLAQLSSAFTIDWTLATNQVRTLNQSEMLQVGAALGVHVQTQFAKGQSLRVQIDAATTQAEVEAVVW